MKKPTRIGLVGLALLIPLVLGAREAEELGRLRAENASLQKRLAALAVENAQLKGKLAAIAPTATGPTEAFVVEDYEFSWTVVRSGDVKLLLQKTPETAKVVLRGKMDSLWLSPEAAEAAGRLLARTPEYAAKMIGKGEADESLKAGGIEVSFTDSPEHGFTVFVRRAGRLVGSSSVWLGRKEAAAVAPRLTEASRRLRFLETKLRKAGL